MLSINRYLPRRPIGLALLLLCATPAWCISPARYFIEARFIPGTLHFQAGQEAKIESESKDIKQPTAKPKCVLDMSVQVTASSRHAGTSDDSEHALALARGEVFKSAVEKSGVQGAALARTYVSFTKSDSDVDTAVFTVMYAPSSRYSTGGIEIIHELEDCWRR
ncbi:hypothetical protein EJP67_24940 [Variovorax guangxiensis]|uniref:Uncharacterized protein n=1 Tax=Variovorax guangxiensis TaxID=1775474 RepID=A0A3S1F4D3_9BURK|nr:hypothetical protein [Variovorax guangxiensis]RUR70306.1 hypothetical protein EJP67_24940 [Variovorax guangxiensis]